jgi:hypothetical protein
MHKTHSYLFSLFMYWRDWKSIKNPFVSTLRVYAEWVLESLSKHHNHTCLCSLCSGECFIITCKSVQDSSMYKNFNTHAAAVPTPSHAKENIILKKLKCWAYTEHYASRVMMFFFIISLHLFELVQCTRVKSFTTTVRSRSAPGFVVWWQSRNNLSTWQDRLDLVVCRMRKLCVMGFRDQLQQVLVLY